MNYVVQKCSFILLVAHSVFALANVERDHKIGFHPGDWSITSWGPGAPTITKDKCMLDMNALEIDSADVYDGENPPASAHAKIVHGHDSSTISSFGRIVANTPKGPVITLINTVEKFTYIGKHDYIMTGKAISHITGPGLDMTIVGYKKGRWISDACLKGYHVTTKNIKPGEWRINYSETFEGRTILNTTLNKCVKGNVPLRKSFLVQNDCKVHDVHRDGRNIKEKLVCNFPSEKYVSTQDIKFNESGKRLIMSGNGYMEVRGHRYASTSRLIADRIGNCR